MEHKAQGNKLFAQGKKEKAIEAYGKGIDYVLSAEDDRDGGSPVAVTEEDKRCLPMLYCNRSMLHLQACRIDEALQDAELGLEADPEYAKAYARRASVLMDMFQFKEALADLEKARDLGLELEEEIQRAKEKLWVPNCFLQEQLALQKKYKCDYVLLLETEEGEKIEEPWWWSKTFKATMRSWRSRFEKGTDLNGMLHFLELEETKARARFGEGDVYTGMLKVQLEREFGPKSVEKWEHVVNVLERDYSIYHAVELMDDADQKLGRPTQANPNKSRLFFPGAPRWHTIDRATLVKVLIFDIPGYQPNLPLFEACVEQLRRYRQKFSDRKAQCHGCGQAILDPDPQECICGEIYCHYLCHMDNWPKHSSECFNATKSITGVVRMTMTYWQLVGKGHFPLKDEPDVVQLWKERKFTPAMVGGELKLLEREWEFYNEMDQKNFMAECAVLQTINNNNRKGNHMEMAITGKWRMRMENLLPGDSPARIRSKYHFCVFLTEHFELVMKTAPRSRQRLPVHTPALLKELAQMFLDFIKENVKENVVGRDFLLRELESKL